MDTTAIAVVAALVLAYGLVSARLATTAVSGPMVFVAAGVLLSGEVTGIIDFGLDSALVEGLIELTLLILLFSDATRIDLSKLRREAALPGRLLVLGLPVTIAAGTAAGMVVLDLPVWDAALLAVMLAPTDAALGQAVVTKPAVPVRIRQTLNVESGLNDGIALPLFTVALALAGTEADAGRPVDWLTFAAEQIGFGLLAGAVIGVAGAWLIDQASDRSLIDGTFQQLSTFAVAVGAWAAAGSLGGNGFIAAFVAGLAFGAVARGRCHHIESFTEDEGHLLSLLTFLVFGGAFVAPLLGAVSADVWLYAALSLTVVRMAPVAIALVGRHLASPTVAFLGWFGPRGLASILFVVLLTEEGVGIGGSALIADTVAVTVLLSVFAHGMSANVAADRYASFVRSRAATTDMAESMEVAEHPVRRTSFGRRRQPQET